MRALATAIAVLLSAGTAQAITIQENFAQRLEGPWGRVDINWRPYLGVLSKNSCPPDGVSRPSSIGLFGEGGSMWIEAGPGGSLAVSDGGAVPRTLLFMRMEGGSAAVYNDGGVQKKLSLVAADRLSEERVPPVPGVPGTKYLRCKQKKP